ncbi:two component transcriptional regulator, LytTR family [Variovorax sp. OK605]|jgi:two-component system response regulator AlgR|uniref:LytR/AlgR family response regulator transcription factor n=1 Tax=unclassified Variovorax TaxID=663243 RepID=UPI0008B1CA3D|nr:MULTISPECIES: LytTR family DNA-binding domain-containing protein [unclassified Variovorax]SEJ16192.1 two component transcriptional regulator, LytTR family [Variovorax sp. OK202]SFC06951.1 two component transcriptional regulator, LytTR family [Variovorax sp. OK212]SFO71524.1 two component transcriptional regulator, LytTR family [Variovorax sp. OK605]
MTLKTLIVDDESLARSRLRTLLRDCTSPAAEVVAEASQGAEALQQLAAMPLDLVLLDVHMPGVDGIEVARALRSRGDAPAVVFVTAHASHAVTAFDLDAVDYLTKPVRAERLQQALQKAERFLKERRALQAAPAAPVAPVAPAPPAAPETVLIQDRGRSERVPLSEVLYLKSEYKYLTVRTATRSHILDGSLNEFEERYPNRFLRVHRNALVARAAIRALEKYDDGEDAEGWALRLDAIPEPVAVSRRQLAAVREVLKETR